MCVCVRKQWAGHLRGFLSGEQNGGGRGNHQRPRDKETGREDRDQSGGLLQSQRIEQQEAAQIQSWAFFAWDSNSWDPSPPKSKGSRAWVNRGEAAPRPSRLPRRLCGSSRPQHPRSPIPGAGPARRPRAPPNPNPYLSALATKPGVSATQDVGLSFPLGPPGPNSAGGAGGYQRLSSPLRGPHLTPQGIPPWKVCAPEKKELPPPWWNAGAVFEAPSVSELLREGEA